jgi:hypothetical protein
MIAEAVVIDLAGIIVPRHLLSANAATSFEFCTIMLKDWPRILCMPGGWDVCLMYAT